jgi:hypothetical protein
MAPTSETQSFVDTGPVLSQLRQLRAEHQALEARLQTLEQQRSLTSAEQLERAELKKRKLAAKDRIARLSRQKSE